MTLFSSERDIRAIVRVLVYLFLSTCLSACASYSSYSVEFQNNPTRATAPPAVNPVPVIETDEFNVYRAEFDTEVLFLVPTQLFLTESYSRKYLAINLERDDGKNLFLIATFSPNSKLLLDAEHKLNLNEVSFKSLSFYPIDTLTVRPLTDPREPETIRITAVTGKTSPAMPFSVLAVIEVNGNSNILSFKQLVESNSGFQLLAFYDLLTKSKDLSASKTISIQVVLRSAYITNQTI